MKLHIDDRNGVDLHKAALCMRAEIYLDGVQQNRCIMADEEKGVIERYIPQDDPSFKVEMIKQGGNCWPTETVSGVVKIVDPEACNEHSH